MRSYPRRGRKERGYYRPGGNTGDLRGAGDRSMRLLAAVTLLVASTTAASGDAYVYVAVAGDQKITACRMDPDTGKLTHAADTRTDGEPGALTTDPGRRFLFASIRSAGKLAAFRIDPQTGKLAHVNTVPAGADPAHLSTDKEGKYLLCAYYVAAKVTVHAIGKDGSLSPKPRQTVATAAKAHAVLL